MRRINLWRIAAVTLALGGPASLHAAEQQYSVTSFDTVRMQGPFNVVIATGKGNSARGEGDRQALDRVSLSVSGGVLTIRALPPRMGENGRNAGRATLYITTSTVRRVLMGGNGMLKIVGMKGVRADLNLAGDGDLEATALAADQLAVNLAGNGRIRLAGRAGSARMQIMGAGSIEAPSLVTKTAMVDSQGAGSVSLTATGTAEITAKGSGNITVLGSPVCKINLTGSGAVNCGGE